MVPPSPETRAICTVSLTGLRFSAPDKIAVRPLSDSRIICFADQLSHFPAAALMRTTGRQELAVRSGAPLKAPFTGGTFIPLAG